MPDHDPAAVGAAAKIRIYRATCAEEHYPMDDSEAARIITDAYRPRLTAEREVRENLAIALEEAETWMCKPTPSPDHPIEEEFVVAKSIIASSLAAAKKLEKCR